jgi:hypothetical protein
MPSNINGLNQSQDINLFPVSNCVKTTTTLAAKPKKVKAKALKTLFTVIISSLNIEIS